MSFPSAGQLIRHYNLFLISGPLVLVISAIFWFKFVRSISKPPDMESRQSRAQQLVIAAATLLIGSVHSLGIYASIANARRFRFDPREVTEIRVLRVNEEGSVVNAAPRTMKDRVLLAEGLSRLPASESRSRNHEHYSDGYRIQIIVPCSPLRDERFLTVYRRSSREGTAAIVIPHIGTSHSGTVNHAGEYVCPSFHEWITKNVDPLFGDR